MHLRWLRATPAVAALCLTLASCRPPDAGRGDGITRAYSAVMAAEDARPAGGPSLRILVEATQAAAPRLRGAGVRALGRLEDPRQIPSILPLLADPDPSVRAEAANALAQSVHRGDGSGATRPLERRAGMETNPEVLGVLARSLGRLRLSPAERAQVQPVLVRLTRGPDGPVAPPEQILGAVLGLDSFTRGGPVGNAVIARLRTLASYDREAGADPEGARVREVALGALTAGRGLTRADGEAGLSDPDERVRRVAVAGLARWVPTAPVALFERGLADPAAPVRIEAVQALGGRPHDDDVCRRLVMVVEDDPDAMVRTLALDALGMPCPANSGARTLLARLAATLPEDGGDWHEPTHAWAALAGVDDGAARTLLPTFASYANPFVRSWAARTAARLGEAGVLRGLASDRDANVRAEAMTGLRTLAPATADTLMRAALESDDAPQVILVAAGGLGDSPQPAKTLSAALGALKRLGGADHQTLRDPRVALVQLIGELGDSTTAPEMAPFLRDFDRVVADSAASVLHAWTGEPWLAAPRDPARLPLPTAADLQAMATEMVVLHMERGGEIRVQLLPLQAPTNAFRLREMARSGALDGLTFHRVVPNFVIQGGSPLANEYAGHGQYTRDEVGLTVQWRGTVGVSTRGRDTGDGQIYVNLVDNVRLDHDYTVLGIVTAGMDVVDAVEEGDRIRHAEVVPAE